MTTETLETTSHVRRRRARRAAVWVGTAAAAVLVVCFAINHYTDPERVRRLAVAHLQRIVGGDVRIRRAEFSLMHGLRLHDVRIALSPSVPLNADRNLPPNHTGPRTADRNEPTPNPTPAFTCRMVELRTRPWAMVFGRLRIDLLSAIEPTCTIVHDPSTGTTNVAGLIRRVMEASARGAILESLPVIELRDARVRVLERDAAGTRQVENLRLTVRGKPAPRDPHLYDLVWHSGDTAASRGYSQLDLHTGYLRNVRGGLPSMSIEAVMLAINAHYDGAGAWNSLLGLGGRVRARDYNLIGTPGENGGRSATIDLDDATISIPINAHEQTLPRAQRYLRFSGVNGTVVATTHDLRADFRGTLHGATCSVRAVLRGNADELRSLEDVSFDVTVSIKDYTVPRDDAESPPEEARFVQQFPRLAANIHAFDPHGRVDVDVHITKQPGPGEPVRLERALITLRGTDASARVFPYRGYDLSGEIEVTPTGVSVRGIRGEHDGAVLNVDGWLAGPNKCAAANFTIVGRNIAIDDTLLRALKPHARATADSFSPRGRVDVNVDLRRAACAGGETHSPWLSVVDVGLTGAVSAVYAHFPYPLDHLTGRVVVEKNRTRVLNVRGEPGPPGHGEVRVDGEIRSNDHRLQSVDLRVRGAGLALDAPLFDALPDVLRARVRAFRPTGRFDITTQISLDPETKALVHESDVQLTHVAVTHEAFPIPVVEIAGPVHLSANRASTTGLTGRYRDTEIAVTGSVRPTDPAGGAELRVSCRDLTLDDATRALLPRVWDDRLGSWRFETPIDVELDVRSGAGADPHTTVKGVARFAQAVVGRAGSPVRLEKVRGEVSFDPSGLRGLGITGVLGQARFQTSFEQHGDSSASGGVVSLTATSVPLNDETRKLLPVRLQSAWDRLRPEGTVDLFIDELSFGPKPQDATECAACSLRARLALHDVSLRSSGGPRNMTGKVTIAGTVVDRLGGVLLSGDMTLSRAKLLDRDLEQVEGAWSLVRTADGIGRFDIKQLQARLYDGSVTGEFELNTGSEQSTYRLSTTIQGSDLNPLVNAGRSMVDEQGAPADVQGRVDCHAYLSGILGDDASRRGGGALQVRDGHIYKLPLMAAILHVLNVALPTQHAPQSADTSFFVIGDRVDLSRIVLRGAALELVGAGTMSLPDYAVELELANVNPRTRARIPVFTDFVEGASRELVGLKVTGPIGRPTVRTRPLGGLSDEFKLLFQKRKPKSLRPAGS